MNFGVSMKSRFHCPPNTEDCGSKTPEKTPKKYKKDGINDEMVQKKRRNLKENGCVTDLKGD